VDRRWERRWLCWWIFLLLVGFVLSWRVWFIVRLGYGFEWRWLNVCGRRLKMVMVLICRWCFFEELREFGMSIM